MAGDTNMPDGFAQENAGNTEAMTRKQAAPDRSPMWCNVVEGRDRSRRMAKKATSQKMKIQTAGAVRASISFPADVYETLENIAKEKKVSLAWVVREAAEQYIGGKWPLFSRKANENQ